MDHTSLSQSAACHLLRVIFAGSLHLSKSIFLAQNQAIISLHEAFFDSPPYPGFTFPYIPYGQGLHLTLAVASGDPLHMRSVNLTLSQANLSFYPDSAKLIPT